MGQRSKWDKLYVAHHKSLINYAAPILGSRDEAEDTVQDAFVKFAGSSGASIKDDSLIKAYLYSIVRNLSFNKIKRVKRSRQQAVWNLPWWALPRETEGPEDDAILSDRVSLVNDVLARLPERTQAIVRMHRFDGYTLEEIADTLGISVTTAHRLLAGAMEEIKASLRMDL